MRIAALALALGMLPCLPRAPAAAADAPADPSVPDNIVDVPSARRDEVTRVLRKIRLKYGDDALVIDTQLLLNAMRNGSVLTTGTRVEGLNQYRGKRYLRFHVETGLIFDDNTRNETARVHMLWHTIMAPTLEHLKGLSVRADGIAVRMQYHHRPYGSQQELRDSILEPGASEETIFYLSTPDVIELADQRISSHDLLGRAQVAVDGSERRVPVPTTDEPRSAGPD